MANALQALLKAHHFNRERRRYTEAETDLILIARRMIAQGKYLNTKLAHAMIQGVDCEMFCTFGQKVYELDASYAFGHHKNHEYQCFTLDADRNKSRLKLRKTKMEALLNYLKDNFQHYILKKIAFVEAAQAKAHYQECDKQRRNPVMRCNRIFGEDEMTEAHANGYFSSPEKAEVITQSCPDWVQP
jgi:hypothetical protein